MQWIFLIISYRLACVVLSIACLQACRDHLLRRWHLNLLAHLRLDQTDIVHTVFHGELFPMFSAS